MSRNLRIDKSTTFSSELQRTGKDITTKWLDSENNVNWMIIAFCFIRTFIFIAVLIVIFFCCAYVINGNVRFSLLGKAQVNMLKILELKFVIMDVNEVVTEIEKAETIVASKHHSIIASIEYSSVSKPEVKDHTLALTTHKIQKTKKKTKSTENIKLSYNLHQL